MYLNASIPQIECFVRAEYLYNFEDHKGEFIPCTIYGVRSLAGRAIGFHILTKDTGASIWNLPISAFVHAAQGRIKDISQIPHYDVDMLQLWDCFSYQLAVTEFEHLSGRLCMAILKNKKKEQGNYLFTIDWYGNNFAESAGDGGHKCAHVVELECGLFCALPNNRILWADPAHIMEPFKERPDYKTQERTWQCEHESRWAAGDGMFYPIFQDDLMAIRNGDGE